jgi:hypothetical protein
VKDYLEYYTTYPKTIIEGAPLENGGKGAEYDKG